MSPAYDRFLAFHEANPQVYQELEALALRLRSKGCKWIGMRMLWETLRYNNLETATSDPYKLNNSYVSYYARLLLQHHPELSGAIEIRERQQAKPTEELDFDYSAFGL